MNCRNLRGFALALTAVLAFTYLAAAQNRPNFNRERSYDVQHYIIRIGFDRPAKRITGDTTVQLKPLKAGFNEAELDAVGLKFDSVKLEPAGTDLKYRTADDKIIVTLDRAYSPGELIAIRFKYSSQPKKGVYFVDELSMPGQDLQPPQIWSQGESEFNRYWFPSYDSPNDFRTSELTATVDKPYTVV